MNPYSRKNWGGPNEPDPRPIAEQIFFFLLDPHNWTSIGENTSASTSIPTDFMEDAVREFMINNLKLEDGKDFTIGEFIGDVSLQISPLIFSLLLNGNNNRDVFADLYKKIHPDANIPRASVPLSHLREEDQALWEALRKYAVSPSEENAEAIKLLVIENGLNLDMAVCQHLPGMDKYLVEGMTAREFAAAIDAHNNNGIATQAIEDGENKRKEITALINNGRLVASLSQLPPEQRDLWDYVLGIETLYANGLPADTNERHVAKVVATGAVNFNIRVNEAENMQLLEYAQHLHKKYGKAGLLRAIESGTRIYDSEQARPTDSTSVNSGQIVPSVEEPKTPKNVAEMLVLLEMIRDSSGYDEDEMIKVAEGKLSIGIVSGSLDIDFQPVGGKFSGRSIRSAITVLSKSEGRKSAGEALLACISDSMAEKRVRQENTNKLLRIIGEEEPEPDPKDILKLARLCFLDVVMKEARRVDSKPILALLTKGVGIEKS